MFMSPSLAAKLSEIQTKWLQTPLYNYQISYSLKVYNMACIHICMYVCVYIILCIYIYCMYLILRMGLQAMWFLLHRTDWRHLETLHPSVGHPRDTQIASQCQSLGETARTQRNGPGYANHCAYQVASRGETAGMI